MSHGFPELKPHVHVVHRIKKTDASKLQDEYAKLVEGLQEASNDEDAFVSNPGTALLAQVDGTADP